PNKQVHRCSTFIMPPTVKSKFTVSLFLSLAVLLFGFAGMAQEETQTSSETVGEGARKVIEGVLSEYDLEEELEDWESLIDDGVPTGIVVSVVKSLQTGHLDEDSLENVYEDLQDNVVEGDKPVGLTIKSIKTAYDLPEKVENEEFEGKPDEAGQPEEKGQNGKSEEDNEKDKGSDKSKGDSEGNSDEAGPPDDEDEDE
ncbi:MAG: hypothetical protein V5A81_01375, partial [Candidatus Bipolaricaulota bacterium]